MYRLLLRLTVAATLLMSLAGCATTPDPTAGRFESRSVTVDGHVSRYQVFVPADALRAAGPLPVVLFLHGSGERGRDGMKQTKAGIGPYLREHASTFPALVVLPQVPNHQEWDGLNNRIALAALDATLAEFSADPSRQYLTGMSMGGYGSWNIAVSAPDRFAAIVPVCGAVIAPREERQTLFVAAVANEADPYTALAQRLKNVPVWMFHGAQDDVVLPRDDRRLHAAFKAAGAADARYTEYPDGNHNAWDATYADTAMWTWLFAQKR
ncbi:prolyl oligopeptidase family protein [Stenotrophomonas maltophilia]|uniref:carboxylesterase family protein n=1 Tax=Stenotrophomonas chelatiphaga TaxID=517011 RepID=UPI000F4B66D1|nr:prolyl oligopeptidase family serine peptidase [Stenotrophomonas chelatiphaga]MCS4231939.1 putative peptidase [Stenotrophomonas chelatiphaga]ROQ45954.1 prolyl oligopeptidase family protein [Stenotrophomonas maltophilia]